MAPSSPSGTFLEHALLSAAEVLGWIGFRDAAAVEMLARQYDDFHRKWLVCDLEEVYVADALEALEIRAKSSPPYCPVAWTYHAQLGERPVPGRYTNRFCSNAAPQQLRRIRSSLRAWTGRLVSYSEVADELRRDVSDRQRSDEAMAQAERELMEALRARKIVVRGRPCGVDGAPIPRSLHEEIPFNWLCDRDVTIRQDGIAGLRLPAPLGRLFADAPREYCSVEFEAKEVLSIWPKPDKPTIEQLPTPGLARAAATIADEKRLQRWLVSIMRDPSERPQSKAAMATRATAAGHNFSDKGFNRSFTAAAVEADAPAWSLPGRKS
jgi:hypothetical protein